MQAQQDCPVLHYSRQRRWWKPDHRQTQRWGSQPDTPSHKPRGNQGSEWCVCVCVNICMYRCSVPMVLYKCILQEISINQRTIDVCTDNFLKKQSTNSFENNKFVLWSIIITSLIDHPLLNTNRERVWWMNLRLLVPLKCMWHHQTWRFDYKVYKHMHIICCNQTPCFEKGSTSSSTRADNHDAITTMEPLGDHIQSDTTEASILDWRTT